MFVYVIDLFPQAVLPHSNSVIVQMSQPNVTACPQTFYFFSEDLTQSPRRVFWSGGGGVNRSRKGESSSVMPGARSPGKNLKFKSSEMAGNGSCKQIYIDKKLLKWLEMHPASSCTLTKDTSTI